MVELEGQTDEESRLMSKKRGFVKPPKPANEAERLKRLYEYKILDTDPEQRFDDLTSLASYICETPVAMITLIDSERQWVKSMYGEAPKEIERDIAFCSHTILHSEPLIVEDLSKDDRFSENPLVEIIPPIVRFYAGVPVFSYDGLALGSLCVVDRVPRHLRPEQVNALSALSRQVHDQMELRRNLFELRIALDERTRSENVLKDNEERFKQILDTTLDGILVEENELVIYMNRAYAHLFGCNEPSELMGVHIKDLAAPEDLERLLDYGRKRSAGQPAPTEYEFKVKRRDNGERVDLEATVSVFTHADKKYIITAVRDIRERKKNEREREHLISELKDALAKVKTLKGLLPICSSCKKIRDDKGYWNRIETYIESHSEADFTHGICPECMQKLYPELMKDDLA